MPNLYLCSESIALIYCRSARRGACWIGETRLSMWLVNGISTTSWQSDHIQIRFRFDAVLFYKRLGFRNKCLWKLESPSSFHANSCSGQYCCGLCLQPQVCIHCECTWNHSQPILLYQSLFHHLAWPSARKHSQLACCWIFETFSMISCELQGSLQ